MERQTSMGKWVEFLRRWLQNLRAKPLGKASDGGRNTSGSVWRGMSRRRKLACWRSLTPREQQIAAMICQHLRNRQIAQRLVVSPNTVKGHVHRVLTKFGVHSKAELRQTLADWDFEAMYASETWMPK